MIGLAEVGAYGAVQDGITTAAISDLKLLLDGLDGSGSSFAPIMFDTAPDLLNPYASASSAVAASFYEETRAAAGIATPFAAGTLDEVPRGVWSALLGWALRPSPSRTIAVSVAFPLLAGGLTRILTRHAADTMVSNAAIDTVTTRVQRVPSAGCCAWCAMIASRGSQYSTSRDYVSDESSHMVVGRGVPVESTKGRVGGQGRGLRPRGSQSIGEDFHDNCRCRTVAVTEHDYVELDASADEYFEYYADARDKVNEGLSLTHVQHKSPDGSLKNKYSWTHETAGVLSPKDKTDMIVDYMRHEMYGDN